MQGKLNLRCKLQEIWGSDYLYVLACLCLLEQFLNCRVGVAIVFTSLRTLPKKDRNKTEKSLKMKRDVGMACQKVHRQGRI